MNRILIPLLLLGMAGLPLPRANSCSTILAGKHATADGSVLMSHSCDGDVYGGLGDRSNSLREWRALSLVAPSLGLKVTGDPASDRYPFSVKPDRPLTVPKLMDVMRDGYEGTEFDLPAQSAFKVAETIP